MAKPVDQPEPLATGESEAEPVRDRRGIIVADRYRIQEPLLGAGGVASNYVAFDMRLARQVSIKLGPTGDKRVINRQERLIQDIGTITHPNIIRLMDAGTDKDLDYFVTELLDGTTLRDELNRHDRVPVERALSITLGIAHGLAIVHSRGIVHRDLKPENVFLVSNGSAVKILDFGLAKHYGDPRSEATVIGTPGYMSPEMVRGLPIDGRADIFSLGVMLYEMLTGERPFSGTSKIEVMSNVVDRRFEPLPKSLPRPVARLVSNALEKNPDQRISSANAFAQQVQRILAAHQIMGSSGGVSTARSDYLAWPSTVLLDALLRLWARAKQIVASLLPTSLPTFSSPKLSLNSFNAGGYFYPVRTTVDTKSWRDLAQELELADPSPDQLRRGIHSAFQRLFRVAPHEQTDADRHLWAQLLSVVNWDEFLKANPREDSRTGRLVSKTLDKVDIEWFGLGREEYDFLQFPGAIAAASPNALVSVRFRRQPDGQIDWLDCQVNQPLETGKPGRDLTIEDLPGGDWPKRN